MKTYIAKRNHRSEPEAIQRLSKYGIAKVFEITESQIFEEYVNFEVIPLGPKNLGSLLKKIHSEKNSLGTSLVHGDFGEYNTTIINGESKCFDYEYAHFGNTYADIGRVVLRDCSSENDFVDFFANYFRLMPKPDILRKGLIYFCDWQYMLRSEKGLPYANVPLIRKGRLKKARDDLNEILDLFKSEVKLK